MDNVGANILKQRLKQEGLLRTSNVPREIARRKIKLLDKLGEGQFGDVFKGTVNEVTCGLF